MQTPNIELYILITDPNIFGLRGGRIRSFLEKFWYIFLTKEVFLKVFALILEKRIYDCNKKPSICFYDANVFPSFMILRFLGKFKDRGPDILCKKVGMLLLRG